MWFDVTLDASGSVPVEGIRMAKLFGKHASEVAKAYGMFLKHKGLLKSYAKENEPLKIEVNWTAGKACFNTWYTIETLEIGQKGTKIIVECYFAKKVCFKSLFTLCKNQHTFLEYDIHVYYYY